MNERHIQRAIRQYLAGCGFGSVHVVNGTAMPGTSEQKARVIAQLKRDGMTPGFPDLLVYGTGGRIGHIEVKAEGGRQSPAQKEVQAWLESIGHRYAVCRSVADAEETLRGWGWI